MGGCRFENEESDGVCEVEREKEGEEEIDEEERRGTDLSIMAMEEDKNKKVCWSE